MFQKYMEKEFSSAFILLCGYAGRFSFGIPPTPAGGYCVSTLNHVHSAPKPVGITASYVTMHLVQRV